MVFTYMWKFSFFTSLRRAMRSLRSKSNMYATIKTSKKGGINHDAKSN